MFGLNLSNLSVLQKKKIKTRFSLLPPRHHPLMHIQTSHVNVMLVNKLKKIHDTKHKQEKIISSPGIFPGRVHLFFSPGAFGECCWMHEEMDESEIKGELGQHPVKVAQAQCKQRKVDGTTYAPRQLLGMLLAVECGINSTQIMKGTQIAKS